MQDEPRPAEPPVPTALVDAPRKRSWAWVLPVLTVAFAAFLAYQAWSARGPQITIRFEDGNGIQTGDRLLYRGISVGFVERSELSDELDQVVLTVRLDPRAEALARQGSRFWVVRPALSLERVAGLDTLLGSRYLAVLPGAADGERQNEFVGLEEPPVLERVDPEGLEIQLESVARYSLQPGAPVLYRQQQVGTVLSVGLSSDATTVEVQAYIRPEYKGLVRDNSRFWEVSGIDINLDLVGGLAVRVDTLRTVLVGGVGLATPSDPGRAVSTGHRFDLHSEPDPVWLEWRPALALGSSLLPGGTVLPEPLRASLSWSTGRLFGGNKRRQGWVLPVDGGVLGPADVLRAPEDAEEGSPQLELSGERLAPPELAEWQRRGLCVVAYEPNEGVVWSADHVRAMTAPEDCAVIGDPSAPPVPLAAGRLRVGQEGFVVDSAISFSDRWHGACVLARTDGALVGLLLVGDEGVRVATIDPDAR